MRSQMGVTAAFGCRALTHCLSNAITMCLAGSVWKAKHKKSGKIVVLKVMRKQELIVRQMGLLVCESFETLLGAG